MHQALQGPASEALRGSQKEEVEGAYSDRLSGKHSHKNWVCGQEQLVCFKTGICSCSVLQYRPPLQARSCRSISASFHPTQSDNYEQSSYQYLSVVVCERMNTKTEKQQLELTDLYLSSGR